MLGPGRSEPPGARVRLSLNPPDKALVLCVDEKSQVQALERSAPILPARPGVAEKRTHDYLLHATTTLFAALEVATGRVIEGLLPCHRHEEFLRLLKIVAKIYPVGSCTSSATTTPPTNTRRADLAGPPPAHRLALHPHLGLLAEMVEIFFGIITRQEIRRGSFTSVADLITAIDAFIAWLGTSAVSPSSGPRPPTSYWTHCKPGPRTSSTRH